MNDKDKIIIPAREEKPIIIQKDSDDIKKHGYTPSNLPIENLKPIEKPTKNDE